MRRTAGDDSELDFGAKKARAADILWREVVVYKMDTTRMRRMIVIAFFQQFAVLSSAFLKTHGLLYLA